MESKSIIEMYEVVIHPVMTLFLFAMALFGVVMSAILSEENYELKIKLGKIDPQHEFSFSLWVLNLSGRVIVYIRGYFKVALFYYQFYKVLYESNTLSSIKK